MTVAFSAPLQTAIYGLLNVAPGLSGKIFDAAPQASLEANEPYVTLGDEVVSPWNTGASVGAAHSMVIRIYAPGRGFMVAKVIAAKICDLLSAPPPALSHGTIVSQEFVGAATSREANDSLRRVDMTFRFIIEDTAE